MSIRPVRSPCDPAARRGDHLARRPSEANGKLLERCLYRKQKREPEPFLRVIREGHAGLPQLAQSLRAEPAEVHEAAEREERLVGGDVRGRLLAADVLLARLQRQHVATAAL